MNTKTHTDIKPDGWVARLPGGLRPYAVLARLDRPVGIWLLLLPGLWAILMASGGLFSLGFAELRICLLFAAGAAVMRAAGCVINDLWDRELDARVARTRTRPLAAGVVSARGALIFLALLLGAGLMILLQFNRLTAWLGVLSLPLVVAYPLMKRWTWWPQAFLGLTFNFGALMGWAAVTGELSLSVALLYAGGIFWTLGYDTIYAHQDREDDALAGIKSTALRLGRKSRGFVAICYVFAWSFIALAAFRESGVLGLLFMIPAAWHLCVQVRKWNPDDPGSSLKTFRSNRDFALLVLAGI